MIYTIAKHFAFSASHQLTGLAADHPCMRLHGHNYDVELVLAADHLDERGFVVDYHDLRPFSAYLDTHLDHQHLNAVLGEDETTAERIAARLLRVALSFGLPAVAVRVSETPKTWAEARIDQ